MMMWRLRRMFVLSYVRGLGIGLGLGTVLFLWLVVFG